MTKKGIIATAIVALVVLGVLFVFRKQTGNPVSDSPVRGSEVVYTDSGFSPNNLLVRVGESVTFQNQSSSDMWVASNPHPIHTDYAEFDAKRGYKPGESYSFVFSEPGSWKYHNHMNPADMGSVTVEP